MSTRDDKGKSPVRDSPTPTLTSQRPSGSEEQSPKGRTRKRGGKRNGNKNKDSPGAEPAGQPGGPSQQQSTTQAAPAPATPSPSAARNEAAGKHDYGTPTSASGTDWKKSQIPPETIASIFSKGTISPSSWPVSSAAPASPSSAATAVSSSNPQQGATRGGDASGVASVPGRAAAGASSGPTTSSAPTVVLPKNPQQRSSGGGGMSAPGGSAAGSPSRPTTSSAPTVVPPSTTAQRASGSASAISNVPGGFSAGASRGLTTTSAAPATPVGNQQHQKAGGGGTAAGASSRPTALSAAATSFVSNQTQQQKVAAQSPSSARDRGENASGRGGRGSHTGYKGPQPKPERFGPARAWGGEDFEARIRAYDRIDDLSKSKQELTPENMDKLISQGVPQGEATDAQKLENLKRMAEAQDRTVADQRQHIGSLLHKNAQIDKKAEVNRKALKKYAGQEEELAKVRTRLAECEAELARNEEERSADNANGAESGRLVEELRRQLKTKNDQLADLQDRNALLEEDLRKGNQSDPLVEELRWELKTKDDRLSELENKNSHLEAERQKNAESDQLVEDLRRDVRTKDDCIVELGNNISSLEAEGQRGTESEQIVEELQQELKMRDDSLSELESKISRLDAGRQGDTELDQLVENLQQDLRTKDDRLSEMENKNSCLETDLQKVSDELANDKKENRGLHKGMSKKDKEVEELQDYVAKLEEEKDAHANMVEIVKKERDSLAEDLNNDPLVKENELLWAKLQDSNKSPIDVGENPEDRDGKTSHPEILEEYSTHDNGEGTETKPEAQPSGSQHTERRGQVVPPERRVVSLPADLSHHKVVTSSSVQTELPTGSAGTQTENLMRDITMQTDPLVETRRRLTDFGLLTILLFFAFLLIWASRRDALRLWTQANDLFRMSLAELSPHLWTPFLCTDKLAYSAIASHQLNRPLLG